MRWLLILPFLFLAACGGEEDNVSFTEKARENAADVKPICYAMARDMMSLEPTDDSWQDYGKYEKYFKGTNPDGQVKAVSCNYLPGHGIWTATTYVDRH